MGFLIRDAVEKDILEEQSLVFLNLGTPQTHPASPKIHVSRYETLASVYFKSPQMTLVCNQIAQIVFG